jgi:uncharacterized protein YndB with AHSA1/START domain
VAEKRSSSDSHAGVKDLVITRAFNAPRTLVWKAWTEPEQLTKWWGPKGMPISVHKFYLRPGGTFHYSMRAADGSDWWGKFVYREIKALEKIVFVNSFSDAKEKITRHPMWPTWPLEVFNTLTFTEQDGKTTLTLRGSPINATEEEQATFEAHIANVQQGFKGTFDQLEEYLANS